MESVWGSETRSKLKKLFAAILESAGDVARDDDERPCISFTDFISYFSPHIRGSADSDSYRERFEEWRAIKGAVRESPLSARNRSLREKESVSAVGYRERLSDVEKVISLLEETVIFDEAEEIKARPRGRSSRGSECVFWRKRILKHREFVRLYQDVVLHQVIAENQRMKGRIERLAKLNKFSKRMAVEEQEWFRKNEHLLQIEEE